ncbi:MAG: hypothetical protein CL681_14600 [Blastopirellula sp.]|nr:hypothetical protein [Blastopirellula sp.]|tara:strand:+ start:360 stop:962 length:603 start_codon:yes stop_codon:yes gene_type:complete
MINVEEITTLHKTMVVRWHEQDVDNPYSGLLGTVCQQFGYNFLLWHEEDIARGTDVPDAKITQVKRNIDRYNQLRNDWIEKIDDFITEDLEARGVEPGPDARLNTETPGSVIDRLSILALRTYHMQEQLERPDTSAEHRQSVEHKLAICFVQHDDLSTSLTELLADINSGQKRHRTYRQLKMYNDPTLNPYLYQARKKAG